MRAFLRFLANLLAFLCAALFVVTGVLALLLFNLERRAFDPATYKQALTREKIYQRMPTILAVSLSAPGSYDRCETNLIACGAENRSAETRACMEATMGPEQYRALVDSQRAPTPEETRQAQACNEQYPSPAPDQPENGGPPIFLRSLKASDWETILRAILPPEESKILAEQAFDSLFAYLNGQSDSAQLSLASLKKNLTSPAGVGAVMQVMRSQPPCTVAQVAKLTVASLLGEGDMEWCSPPDEIISIIQPLIEFQLHVAAAAIPDQVTLIKPPPPEAALSGVVDQRDRLQRIRLIMRLSPLVPLGLLLIITILVVRSLRGWLKWWGWPLLIAGMAGAVIGFLSAPIFRLIYARILAARIPTYVPQVLAQTGSDLAGAVLRQMLKPVAWEGLLLGALGLAMILLAAYMARNEFKKRLATSEANTELF